MKWSGGRGCVGFVNSRYNGNTSEVLEEGRSPGTLDPPPQQVADLQIPAAKHPPAAGVFTPPLET